MRFVFLMSMMLVFAGCTGTVALCSSDAECGGDEYCDGNFCARLAAGEACDRDAVCDSGACEGGSCTGPNGVRCLDDASCEGAALCWRRRGFHVSPVCMSPCDDQTTWRCSDGSLCVPGADPGTSVCYLGGLVSAYDSCLADTDCERGGVCVHRVCHRTCNWPDQSSCRSSEECLLTDIEHPAGNHGYCEPT